MTSVLQMIFYRRDLFFKNAEITPIMVCDNRAIVAACMLIATLELPDTLQLSYFEALEGCQEAVALIMTAAKELCVQKRLKNIVVGLDNTVGILTDHFDCVPCYGMRYNPSYYAGYFSNYSGKEYVLTSYLIDLNKCNLKQEQKAINRIAAQFYCREANFRRFDSEVSAYTYLKNKCFQGQPFFAHSSEEMNYIMFRSYRSLISGQNLLMLEKEGAPVGYLLWFPDFNQLLRPGAIFGPDICRKNRLYGRSIDKIIVSEIGVLPEYQGSGAVLALINKCMQLARGSYNWCETGWILDSNIKSKGFGIRWAGAEYKHYKVFEISV